MKDKILEKRIKIGILFLIFYILISSVSIAIVIVTDESITFSTDPLRVVRYNQANQELEIIENLTVNNLTINGNNNINGNTILCNTSQNCFGGNSTFGNETSYVHINETGIITLHGDARVEKEEIFDMLDVSLGNTKPVKEEIKIGDVNSKIEVVVYTFDPSKSQEVLFVWHTPYDLDPSEDIEFHIEWKPINTWVAGSYNWSLEYIIKQDNGANDTGATTTIWENVTPINANDFIETQFTTKITGATNDDMIFARFYLDNLESTAIENVHVIFIELKYWVNKLGERGFT